MATQETTRPITAEDVQEMHARGVSAEIWDGRWVGFDPASAQLDALDMATGKRHGKLGARFIVQLGAYVEAQQNGIVYQDQVGYVLRGTKQQIELMVIPDVSFVHADRVDEVKPDDYYYQAPDLAVEIISPNDRSSEIRRKVKSYFEHGTQQVWLVYPDSEEISVHLPDGSAKTYSAPDTVPGGDLLPGFALDLTRIFR